MATIKMRLNSLRPDCVPVGLTITYGEKSNNRKQIIVRGTIPQVARLMPALRYRVTHKSSYQEIKSLVASWEAWKAIG